MDEAGLQRIIDGLTLEQKLGQLWMAGLCGGETVELARSNFARYHHGGLMFSSVFERFVRAADYQPCGVCRNAPLEEVAAFLDAVKRAAVEVDGLPPLVGGDQEGGLWFSAFRRQQITVAPQPMGLGASGRPEDAYRAALISAREAKALGLDMLYGPVLDVNASPANLEIGTRSFGESPSQVAELGGEFIRAYHEAGVIATAKHFPGRGRGTRDAHHELESIEVSRAELDRTDLVPFRRALAAGVDAVMVGHVHYPALDPERRPASLSPAVIDGLLRRELGFDGVVLSDTLCMGAVARQVPVPRACALFLEAGGDLFFLKLPQLYPAALAEIRGSLRAGRLTEARLDQSVRRVLRLKYRYGLDRPRPPAAARVRADVGRPEDQAAMRELSRRCVVLLKNNRRPPLDPARVRSVLAVVPRDASVVQANDPELSHELLPCALAAQFPEVRHLVVDVEPTDPQVFEALALSKNAELLVLGVYTAGLSLDLLQLLRVLLATGKPVAVVLAGRPHVAAELPPEVRTIICTFSIGPHVFAAAAEILAGRLDPVGRLPVTVSAGMPRGFGL